MRLNHTTWLALIAALLGPAAARAQPPETPPAGRPPAVAEPAAAPRPLGLRADLGGTEPGTSRQSFEGLAQYRPVPEWEVQAGWTYTDQVYYWSNRGFVTGYRFFNDGLSYVKADATLRRYEYPVDATVQKPNPDSSSYEWVPRGELEASHAFTRMVRAGAQYQLFPASFWHDPSSWAVNHKVSGELELHPVAPLRLGLRAALLRDPDPDATEIKGRPVPGAPGTIAAETHVVYRTTSLVGGFGALELDRFGLKVEYLPNRDLDNSYDWSLLTTLDLRVQRWLELRLQQIHDTYASVSNFPGQTADIWMGVAAFVLNPALRVRGGYRHVDSPSRTGGTLILGVEWRTALR